MKKGGLSFRALHGPPVIPSAASNPLLLFCTVKSGSLATLGMTGSKPFHQPVRRKRALTSYHLEGPYYNQECRNSMNGRMSRHPKRVSTDLAGAPHGRSCHVCDLQGRIHHKMRDVCATHRATDH